MLKHKKTAITSPNRPKSRATQISSKPQLRPNAKSLRLKSCRSFGTASSKTNNFNTALETSQLGTRSGLTLTTRVFADQISSPPAHPVNRSRRGFTTINTHKGSSYNPANPKSFDSSDAVWQPNQYTTRDGSVISPSNALKLKRDLVLLDKNDAKDQSDPNGEYHRHLSNVKKLINRARSNGNILCFTDGSSLANPGPAGCGISIEIPTHSNPIELFQRQAPFLLNVDDSWAQPPASVGQVILARRRLKFLEERSQNNLGGVQPQEGVWQAGVVPNAIRYNLAVTYGGATCNYSEIKAIETAFVYLENLQITGQASLYGKKLFIISDSDWSIKMVTGRFKPQQQYVHLVTQLRSRLVVLEARYGCTIDFVWCKGHVNIEGNELADEMANYAAQFSLEHSLPTQSEPILDINSSSATPLYYTTQYALNDLKKIKEKVVTGPFNELIDESHLVKVTSKGQEYYTIQSAPMTPPLAEITPNITNIEVGDSFPLAAFLSPTQIANATEASYEVIKKKILRPIGSAGLVIPQVELVTDTTDNLGGPLVSPVWDELIIPSKAFLTRALVMRDKKLATIVDDRKTEGKTQGDDTNAEVGGDADIGETAGEGGVASEAEKDDVEEVVVKPAKKTRKSTKTTAKTAEGAESNSSDSDQLELERKQLKERQAKVVAEEMAGLAELIKLRDAAEAKEKAQEKQTTKITTTKAKNAKKTQIDEDDQSDENEQHDHSDLSEQECEDTEKYSPKVVEMKKQLATLKAAATKLEKLIDVQVKLDKLLKSKGGKGK